MSDTPLPPLDFRSWLALVIFLFAALFVNIPTSFRVPGLHGFRFRLNLVTAPLIGVVLALATTTLTFTQLWRGVVGSDGIEPYAILVLLLSLAYICISLDLTGALAMAALWVTGKAGTRGRLFYAAVFAVSLLIALVTNNDVAILTVTPIIIYFAQAMELSPRALLMGEFIAANTASMVLYTGNPTNIVIAQAYGLSFFAYAGWMIIPAIGSSVVSLAILLVQYRGDIPKVINPPPVRPREALKRPVDAGIGSIVLLGCIVAIAVSSFYGISVWIVTLPFGGVAFLFDLGRDLYTRRKARISRLSVPPSVATLAVSEEGGVAVEEDGTVNFQDPVIIEKDTRSPFHKAWTRISGIFPTAAAVAVRLPYSIFPFSLGMFILVEALSDHGWTVRLARVLRWCSPTPTVSAFTVGYITAIASTPFNNIPMSILFARALRSPEFAGLVSDATSKAALFSLAIGSNLGANFTLFASLAGVMWTGLCTAKGVPVPGWAFTKACLWSFPVSVAVACGILAAEIAIMEP